MSPARRPPEGFSDAILEAARIARIGVGVSLVEGATVRNLWFNDVAVEILGRPLEELLTGSAFSFVAPEELPGLTEKLAVRMRGESIPPSFETIALRADGRRVPISVAISHLEIGGRKTTVSFFSDVTERRRAEEALRQSELRFRSVIETAPDAIVISRRGAIVYANPAAARVLGYPEPAALVGVHFSALLLPDDLAVMIERTTAMLTRGERFPAREYRATRPDGSQIVVEITSHVTDYDGAPAILGFGRDVTERVRMQEQLARADRLAALGTLAAGVAHEINNPLAFVSLGIDTLAMHLARLVPDERVRSEILSKLEPIRAGADRVAEIVRDLRAFSRPDEGPARVIDVSSIVRTAERLALHELKHRATLEIHVEGAPRAMGQPGRLEQVLVNLLVNAAQAFDATPREEARVTVRCAERDGAVVIEVADNGPGIPPEILGRVFDPFFTTKAAGVGTGLGLAICHSIVARMGGDIAIESTVGRGTRVRVRVPAAVRPSEPEPSRAERPATRALRVLVIDDEPALLRVIDALLVPGHEVVTALDGEEALARIRAGERFDVVLCDVMMPRLGGRELHAIVARERPELGARFVFMSGGALDPHVDAWLASVPTLPKPFTAGALDDALRSAAGG